MNALKNIGLIVSGHFDNVSHLTAVSRLNGYVVKRIMLEGDASETVIRKNYPDAEIVKDKHALLHDSNLDLLVFTEAGDAYQDMVGEILQSGIPVRIAPQV
ncbi:MAG TPA: hypothetical protein VFZ42_14060 [Chitinophagaceae bacterium]